MTFDADQDTSTGREQSQAQPTWEGFQLIPKVDTLFRTRNWRYTVFLRCDEQIETLEGDCTALYDRHQTLWDSIRSNGNEIGWHPHLYVRDVQKGSDQIRRVHDCLVCKPTGFESVRVGEAWHSTATMNLLSSLGYKVDSTAIPGRKRQDDVIDFDWEPTPNRPYYPFRTDYRTGRPSPSSDTLTILELPMNTAAMQTDYDQAPLKRYLNPCFHPHLFRQGLDNFFNSSANASAMTLTLNFHPGELLPRQPDGLYSFSWSSFERNLDILQHMLETSGAAYRWHIAREAASFE